MEYNYALSFGEPTKLDSDFKRPKGIAVPPEKVEEPEDTNMYDYFADIIVGYFGDDEEKGKSILTESPSISTPPESYLDDTLELLKSVDTSSDEQLKTVLEESSTLGESPNTLEDIYTRMDTDPVTLESQPAVDSKGETLEIGQTESQGLMSRTSNQTQAKRFEFPEDIDIPKVGTEEVSVDSKILSPAFLNSIGVTGNLNEKIVQTEVKKVLKEQGLTDEEITAIVNKSLNAVEVQQRTDIPEGGLGSPVRDTAPLGKGYEGYLKRYTTVDNVDFDFIKELEGYKTDMYVPKIKGQVLENSGATIASGFDLGQRNESDLKGLPQSLINKLKPYLGKKKKAADDFVKANPLTITKKEADIINAFAKKQELDRLIKDWNNSSDVKWENLSKPLATTVASIAFQHGNLPIKTPKFWRYTTTGDWAAARDELRDFYPKNKKGRERQKIYGPRRDEEANYLEQDNAAILGTKAY